MKGLVSTIDIRPHLTLDQEGSRSQAAALDELVSWGEDGTAILLTRGLTVTIYLTYAQDCASDRKLL